MREVLSLKPIQALFILLFSWIITFLGYYFPVESMHETIFEIYSIIGVPSALLFTVLLKSLKSTKK